MFELITYSILAFLALILLMVFMLLYAKSKLVNSGAVKIKINGENEIEVGGGSTPKNKFPDENDEFKKLRFKPKHGKIDVMIKDLPYGELAFAIYHDVNNNGKIDKNAIGIPKERYAFSNNIKPTIKAPSFDDCKFTLQNKLD